MKITTEVLTAGHVDEVLAGGLVDLDVAVGDVVFVPFERHVSVLLADEPDQRLSVAAALLTQAESHSAPGVRRRVRITAAEVGRAARQHCSAVG